MSHKYESFVKALRAYIPDASPAEMIEFVKSCSADDKAQFSRELNELSFPHPAPAGTK